MTSSDILKPERPRIIVPVAAQTLKEAKDCIEKINEIHPDMAELRLDLLLQDNSESCSYADCVRMAREALDKSIPLLVTLRTMQEGGEADLTDAHYLCVCSDIISSGAAELIDVEISHDSKVVGELIRRAHDKGLEVIASSHDFTGTPENSEIELRLRYMEDIGADYLKLAFMPSSGDDVIRLMMLAREYSMKSKRRLIIMSMGELGKASRIFGGFCGSCASFASAGRSSAPGQMAADEVLKIFDELY